jgi:3-deoxy-D-manno-octulosonate 8-phosphate phosphatase (KDO 8-P phosphatase)
MKKPVRPVTRAKRVSKVAAQSGDAALTARLKRIKLFLCDVDGVLTDASIYVGGEREVKRFDIQDGLGLVVLRRTGIKVGWISSRPSPATEARALELKIDFLVQTKKQKVVAVENLLARTGLNWEQVCYLGDDVVDLGAIKRAGVGVAVANAVAEAKQTARYVTAKSGGHGAVREVVELILKAQGLWAPLIAEHLA